MKLGAYKKLKQVLDTESMKDIHGYQFQGTARLVNFNHGQERRYRIRLIPEAGTIYCLPELFRDIIKDGMCPACYADWDLDKSICFC